MTYHLLSLLLAASLLPSPTWAVIRTQIPIQPVQPIRPKDHSQNYEFDPLLHLPGTSPYFDAVGFGLRHEPPVGCHITVASYLVRHTAIYSNEAEYEEYIKPFLWKLESHRGQFTGPLAFLNQWHSPIREDELEEITPQGARDSADVASHLLKRYPDLIPSTTRILSDKKNRTWDTAKIFVEAFPQSNNAVDIVKFSRPQDGSMNPIIPHKSCHNFSKEPGAEDMAVFVNLYASRTSDRLRPWTPFQLVPNDVVAMQSICGYESAITGETSPLCAVFTDAEWMSYEYAWDLRYAHMVGPLNPVSPYLGFPWLSAQTKIFLDIGNDTDRYPTPAEQEGEDQDYVGWDLNGNKVYPLSGSNDGNGDFEGWPVHQRFFLSFTHREVPPLIATALGIFNSSFEAKGEFPTDHVVWTRAWKMADLIPFLGHVGMERMTCVRDGGGHEMNGEFVRIIANTAPRPIPRCQWGPGASCPLDDFAQIIAEGVQEYGDWHSACGMDGMDYPN